MEYFCFGPFVIFFQKQFISFIFIAITYFFLNKYSMVFISLVMAAFKKNVYTKGLSRDSNHEPGELCSAAEEHYYLGETYIKQGMLEEANLEIRKALSINPKTLNGEPYVKLAECSFKKGNYEKGYSLLSSALDWFPSLSTLFKVGELYRKYGRKEQAREVFAEAILSYKNQLKYKKNAEWRWAILVLLKSLAP